MLYPIAISAGDEQHAWGVEVPDIAGCFSAGDTLDDALAMAREAIEGHLELLAEVGEPVPEARSLTVHAGNPGYAGCTWAVVDIDVTRYMGKAEKLNITLPGYLAGGADRRLREESSGAQEPLGFSRRGGAAGFAAGLTRWTCSKRGRSPNEMHLPRGAGAASPVMRRCRLGFSPRGQSNTPM